MHMIDFLGRLHPLILHLPIGIYSLACIMQFLFPTQRKPDQATMQFVLSVGWLSALLTLVFGWMLSSSGDYNESAIVLHKWSAVCFLLFATCLSIVHHLRVREEWAVKIYPIIFFLLMLMMLITGHFGGELTHGENYLFAKEDDQSALANDSVVKMDISDTSRATVYDAMVVPVLQKKCITCHRAEKIKGGLRMDQYELILKGGKGGEVLIPGDPENSVMIQRMLLDMNDDKHMPPKGKAQLSDQEIDLIHWWIQNGARKDIMVANVSSDTVRVLLTNAVSKDVTEALPPIAAADPKSIKLLNDKGIVVRPVAISSGFLEVSAINMEVGENASLKILSSISKNILWLNLSRVPKDDKELAILGSMENLKRADLSYTKATDALASTLTKMQRLEYLNLVGTMFTDKGLMELVSIKNLKQLYGWKSGMTQSGVDAFKKVRPDVKVDIGLIK